MYAIFEFQRWYTYHGTKLPATVLQVVQSMYLIKYYEYVVEMTILSKDENFAWIMLQMFAHKLKR